MVQQVRISTLATGVGDASVSRLGGWKRLQGPPTFNLCRALSVLPSGATRRLDGAKVAR